MALVVVGGHSRDVGKTSVMAGLIRATAERGWTAIKITQFGHGMCAADGKSCECTTDDHRVAVTEERDRSGRKDTSRYLGAGAHRAFWFRVRQGQLFTAMDRLRSVLAGTENAIVESNSVLQFLRPDVYVSVLDGGVGDFKQSARRFLDRADAVLLRREPHGSAPWTRELHGLLGYRRVIPFDPPNYLPDAMVELFRERLRAVDGAMEREGGRSTEREEMHVRSL